MKETKTNKAERDASGCFYAQASVLETTTPSSPMYCSPLHTRSLPPARQGCEARLWLGRRCCPQAWGPWRPPVYACGWPRDGPAGIPSPVGHETPTRPAGPARGRKQWGARKVEPTGRGIPCPVPPRPAFHCADFINRGRTRDLTFAQLAKAGPMAAHGSPWLGRDRGARVSLPVYRRPLGLAGLEGAPRAGLRFVCLPWPAMACHGLPVPAGPPRNAGQSDLSAGGCRAGQGRALCPRRLYGKRGVERPAHPEPWGWAGCARDRGAARAPHPRPRIASTHVEGTRRPADATWTENSSSGPTGGMGWDGGMREACRHASIRRQRAPGRQAAGPKETNRGLYCAAQTHSARQSLSLCLWAR